MIKEVEKQYNDWPYPEPIEDMEKEIKGGYAEESAIHLHWPIIFPEKKYKDNLKIFIAGCGTNQAIYHAFLYPRSEIYAIDISDTSIEHNKRMIEKYGLKNLIIEKKNIFEVNFKENFDYVVSTGVIHHTVDPKKALKILIDSGKPDSAIFIMVYSEYCRVGVYYLQDVFKYLNLKQNMKDINFVKEFLNNLRPQHFARIFGGYGEINNTSVVDTFLHNQDRPYTCLEIEELVKGSGGFFQGWANNLGYYPFFSKFPKERLDVIEKLSQFEIADFTQKIFQTKTKHSFVLRKNKSFQNLWHNLDQIKINTTINQKGGWKTEKFADIEKNLGGSVINKQGIIYEFSLKESVVFQNLTFEIKDINQVISEANKISGEMSLGYDFKFEYVRKTIHDFWKKGLALLSSPF